GTWPHCDWSTRTSGRSGSPCCRAGRASCTPCPVTAPPARCWKPWRGSRRAPPGPSCSGCRSSAPEPLSRCAAYARPNCSCGTPGPERALQATVEQPTRRHRREDRSAIRLPRASEVDIAGRSGSALLVAAQSRHQVAGGAQIHRQLLPEPLDGLHFLPLLEQLANLTGQLRELLAEPLRRLLGRGQLLSPVHLGDHLPGLHQGNRGVPAQCRDRLDLLALPHQL